MCHLKIMPIDIGKSIVPPNDKVTGRGLVLKTFVKRKNLLKGKEKAVRFTDLGYLYDPIPIMLRVSVKISYSGN